MNVLLVYPEYPDTFWSFRYALKFIGKKAAYPPLGLLTIGGMLAEREPTWDLRLVDLNVRKLTDGDISWADMVFVSAMLVQKQSAQEIINRCWQMGKIVVAGGPAFISSYGYFERVNHFVLGEAEITLPLFLADLKINKLQHIYQSFDRPQITATPLPLWSLINFNDYATMSVQYSRGCPFDCEFCDIIIMNGHIQRTKSPEQMIREFQLLYDMGWRGSIFIVDDNFIGNKVKVKKMLVMLIEWQKQHQYPFRFFTEASINLADDQELMDMMSVANFFKVFIGLETPNIDSLQECNKFLNAKTDLVAAVKTIQKNGLQVMGGFIVGFDNDTESIFDIQIKFIQEIGVVTAMVGMLIALPQTRLWERLKAEGRLLGDSSGENTDTSVNFIPKMSYEKLVAGYKKILRSIYSPKLYYQRIWTFIGNYQSTAKGKIPIKDILKGISAFLKSIWEIGIISKARLEYWKLLIKTIILKPRLFPLVVELAIIGLHFEKVAQRIIRS